MSDSPKQRLPIWLIASLMVNALLVGLLIGGGLGQKRAGPPLPGGGSEQALMRGIDQGVSPDDRRLVRQAFRRAFSDSRSERLALREARRQLALALAADPYDPDAVQDQFSAMREVEGKMKARMHTVLAEQFGTLSAEQREAIIADLRNRAGRERSRRPDGNAPRRFQDRD